jgi:hypothetical protein
MQKEEYTFPPQQINLLQNLPAYCEKFLEIEGKEGTVGPFILNAAQMYLHNELEAQLKKQGYVRAILIKGRQQGCTTYIAARYYHKAIYNRGIKVFILSHEAKTTATIFEKVKKYQYNIEKKFRNFAPKTVSLNNNQLVFEDSLGSKYTIGTAGNKEVGRGFTNQLLHLSEAAFYENPEEIEKGLVQSVADVPGTEIIYETTTNGQNFLYQKVKEVLNDPDSDYMIIFIPWYWQEEYQIFLVPPDFNPTLEEVSLQEKYKLTFAQLLWRRKKIKQLGSITSFKQEYPNSLEEAFEFSGNSLVQTEKVVEARLNNFETNPMLPRIMGVDGSGSGKDRTVFVIRQGRKVIHWEKFEGIMTQPKLVSLMIDKIHQWQVDAMFADAAYGEGAVDTLKTLGYRNVFSVHFNMGALNADLYLNKRAEIMCAVAEWFDEGADIPDNQEFADDVLSIPFYKLTASHKRQIVSKEEIKKELGRSTDIMDPLALTFAFPVVKENYLTDYQKEKHNKDRNGFARKSKLHSLNVKRGIS